jgi:hypothetical protein
MKSSSSSRRETPRRSQPLTGWQATDRQRVADRIAAYEQAWRLSGTDRSARRTGWDRTMFDGLTAPELLRPRRITQPHQNRRPGRTTSTQHRQARPRCT